MNLEVTIMAANRPQPIFIICFSSFMMAPVEVLVRGRPEMALMPKQDVSRTDDSSRHLGVQEDGVCHRERISDSRLYAA